MFSQLKKCPPAAGNDEQREGIFLCGVVSEQ